MAVIALVDVDAADRSASEHFEIGDNGAERAAVISAVVHRLGMQHELPALGAVTGVVIDLTRSEPRLRATHTFDLGCVQRIDLRHALALLLMAGTEREVEWVACDFPPDVTDNAAKPRS